jgi:hypothetical protein
MTHTATCCSQHPLTMAYSPTPSSDGKTTYCICGFRGCDQRLAVDAAVWETERARRLALTAGVQVWHARGDLLVPVAPDVDGLVPTTGGRRPHDEGARTL